MMLRNRILRAALALGLTGSVLATAQDLRAPGVFSLAKVEQNHLREARETGFEAPAAVDPLPLPQQQQQPAQAPAAVTPKKSRKGMWIAIAAVAGGAGVAVWAVNKRLGNEGKGIF